MPDKPSYIDMIPEALEHLETSGSDLLTREEVEKLLGVEKRQAQTIIAAAGPTKVGKENQVAADVLKLYLGQFEPFIREELARRRRLAVKLRELSRTPRVLVEIDPDQGKRAKKKNLAGLPEGVTLEPGRLVVTFHDGIDCLQKLQLLAMAIGSDLDAFYQRVEQEKLCG